MDSFSTGLEVEAAVMFDMLWEGILPAIAKQLVLEKGAMSDIDGLDLDDAALKPWIDFTGGLAHVKAALISDANRLQELKGRLSGMESRERADFLTGTVIPHMDSIRAKCDALELTIAADIWPYPIYRNLLSLSA